MASRAVAAATRGGAAAPRGGAAATRSGAAAANDLAAATVLLSTILLHYEVNCGLKLIEITN